MINQYKNIDNILSAKKPTSAVRFNDIDLDFFKQPQLSIEWLDDLIRSVEPTLPASIEKIATDQKSTSDVKVKPVDNRISKESVVEMHVYSSDTWVTGNHRINVATSKTTSYVDPVTNIRYNLSKQPLEIDLYQEFENLNLTRGDFRVVFNFFGNAIGNYEKQTLRIVEISPDRTELRLRSTDQDDPSFLQEISNFIQNANQLATQEEITRLTVNNNIISIQAPAKYKPLLLNFSRNKTALFVNSVVIGDELFVKLYEPLDSTIQLGNACWVVEEKKPSYIDLVSIIAKQIDSRNNRQRKMSGPNWDANSSYDTSNDTGLRNWNELLGSSVSTSQQLVDKIFSGSLSGIELNIDYSDFNNFIFYSSATERVKNFKYKLELLEYYESQLTTLASISGSTAIVNIAEFTDKKTTLIGGFDSFEQYLYYQSGSGYFSNDIPLAQPNVSFITGSYITPYPKSNSTKPYTLEPLTSSIISTWYDTLLANADTYDRFNSNALINAVPLFVKADVSSESLETFIHMLGHHYDILYTYINYMNRIHSRDEHPKYGVPNELLYSVAKQFGWNLTNGNQSEELWSYLLGTDEFGVPQTGSNSVGEASVALSDVTYNTWRRIVNNLPVLLKSKGTKRSVKALLSCYGIPQSMITINEYGGPRIERPPVYEKLNFDYALDLITNTAGTVTVNYDQPINSAELRFRTDNVLTNPTLPSTMNLFSVDSNDVTLDFTRGTLGTIQINGTSSADIEMFDGGWLNVLLRSGSEGSLEVVAKKSKYGKIVAAVSASATASFASTGTFTLGGTSGGSRLQGQLQELRLWSSSLSDTPFNNHTKAPAAYDGNVAAYDELLFRLPLTQKIDHSATSSLTGVEPNLSGISASFDSWSNPIPYDSIEETYYYDAISLAAGTNDDNKIRLEDNELIGTLDVKTRAERSQYDKAPLDSKKLGVYFSPQTMINEDIIAQLGFTELDSYIGDPGQTYEKSYPDLIRAAYEYWKKYDTKNDINSYIKIFSLFDMSFFQQLDQLLPARADKITGLVIQPNILERNKDSVLPRVNPTSLVENGLLDINETTILTGDELTLLGAINDKIGTITAQDDDQLQGYLTKSSAARYDGTTYSYDYLYWDGNEYVTGSTPYWESVGVLNFISGSRLSTERNNQEITYFQNPVETLVTTTSSFQSTYSDNPRNISNPNYFTRDTIIYPIIESSSNDITIEIDRADYAKYITLPTASATSSNVTVSFYELITDTDNVDGNPTASGANIIWGDLYDYVTTNIASDEYPDSATFFNIPISFYGSASNSAGYYTPTISASFGTVNNLNTSYRSILTSSIITGIEVDNATNYSASIPFNTTLTQLYDMLTGDGGFNLNGTTADKIVFKLSINLISEGGADFDEDIFAIQEVQITGTGLPSSYIVANITSSVDSTVTLYVTGSEYGLAEYQDFTGTGLQNSFYNGCKMSSRAINVSSLDTIDGGPVVESRETSPNQLIYQAPGDAGSFVLSGRPGRKLSGNGSITSI